MLVSWAVPKGPTLDPDVRRMAVHVEDHPLDYFDFEGVIPAGEYGGGDVIVWDWGTWALAEADDPLAAIDAGDLHVDLAGEKLRGRFVLVRRRSSRRGGGHGRQGLAAAPQARRGRRRRLGPGGPPAVGQDGPHQRRGQGRAGGDVVEHGHLGRRRPPTSWPRSTRCGKAGEWTLGEHTLQAHEPRQGAVPRSRRRGRRSTKRDLIRHNATIGAGDAAVPRRPAGQHAPLPERRRHAGLLAQGRARRTPPTGSAAGATTTPTRARRPSTSSSTRRRRWRGSPTTAPSSCTRGRRRCATPHQPTWAMIDIDPGDDSTFDDVLVLARLHRTALEHLGVRGRGQGHGEAGHPDLGARRRGPHVRPGPGLGRGRLAGRRGHGARPRQLGVGDGQARGPGPPRLHPERDQQDAGRAVQRPRRAGRAGVGADHLGRARRPRSHAPTAGPSATSANGWPATATPWPR